MLNYIIDDYVEDDDISFAELVLRYIYEDEYISDKQDESNDEIMDNDEFEDYLSLAEYYYSR